jgi:5-formyltetrahydrofolate cyclo-ligase
LLLKKALRQDILRKRSELPAEERKAKSREIENLLFNLSDVKTADIIMFYASFRSEVETHAMVRRALAEGKRVVLPKIKGRDLSLIEITDFDRDVKPGVWAIPEPKGGQLIEPGQIQVIIVPGAAFDDQGNRVGYGAGFYDKLLKEFKGATVALAFELQMVSDIPADAHDVPVQKIITEKRIIRASSG